MWVVRLMRSTSYRRLCRFACLGWPSHFRLAAHTAPWPTGEPNCLPLTIDFTSEDGGNPNVPPQ